MKTHKNEILLYYNPNSVSDRKTLAYAKSVCSHVSAYSFERASTTATNWYSLFSKLDLSDPKKLLNKAHPEYRNKIKGNDLSRTSWTTVLAKNPQLIKSPIAIRGGKVVVCQSPTDVLKLV